MIKERKDRWPERNNGMEWIGEIDAVVPVDDEIARLIVILAIELGIDSDGATVRSKLYEPPPAFLRTIQLAVWAKCEPIDPVGVPAKTPWTALLVSSNQSNRPSSTTLNSALF